MGIWAGTNLSANLISSDASRVLRLTDSASESPDDRLYRMAVGYRTTAALYVVAKLGVADLLTEGPAEATVLAEMLGVHPRSLFRVMRALAAQGVFTQDSSDRFGLTPISQLLRTDGPNSMRYVAIAFGEEHYRATGDLIHTVRTGETAFDHIYGKGLFEYLAENEGASETFNLFFAQSVGRFGNPLESYDFRGRKLLVDVGGGKGTLISRILRSNPHLSGILFDLPQGVAGAERYLQEQGVLARCRIVAGSFFDSIPEGGDVYLMSRILHDWPDDKASLILAGCRKAIVDGGVLCIRDAVIPGGDAPSVGKQIDLTMMSLLGGVERSEQEWKHLLQGSRFLFKRAIKTGQPADLIEASPV